MDEPSLPSFSWKFKRVLKASRTFDQNGSNYKRQKKQFFQEESVARLSQAHYVVEGANLVKQDKLLYFDFFSLSFVPQFVFLGNHKYYHIFQCISWNL
jgi:hypothetical protein